MQEVSITDFSFSQQFNAAIESKQIAEQQALKARRDLDSMDADDIQQAVDRVTTLPEDAEEPRVTLDARRREVVELHLYGDVDARSLRMAAEHVRNTLLQQPEISQVDMEGSRDLEIHVEIYQSFYAL